MILRKIGFFAALISFFFTTVWGQPFDSAQGDTGTETVSIDSFYMDESEIGSNEYREFDEGADSADAEITLGDTATDTTQNPIYNFSAKGEKDSVSTRMRITALTKDGEIDTEISGEYKFKINDDETSLSFENGEAVHEISSDKRQNFFFQHKSEGRTIQKFYNLCVGTEKVKTKYIPLWVSLLPPLLAIILALIFKEVVVSLLVGIWIGCFALWGFGIHPIALFYSTVDILDIYILGALNDSGHLSVILFSLLIGGMVAIISRNGGMAGVVRKLASFAGSSQKSQLTTWFLGIAVFFDDYANSLIVGNTMRPVTDKFKVSREKLAYLVDSTAAPVAAIAFVTTWIGAELDYIGGALEKTDLETSPYSVFLNSLQYSFYPIFTLIFIFMLVMMRRDYGPMLKAERRAITTGQVSAGSADGNSDEADELKKLDPKAGVKLRWYNAFFPVLVTIGVTFIGLLVTGYDFSLWKDSPHIQQKITDADAAGFFGMIFKSIGLVFTPGFLAGIIGNSDSYVALLWGSMMGVLTAMIFSVATKTMKLNETITTLMVGIKTMLPAIIILILAWSLAAITDQLHTGDYLTSVFSGNLNPNLLPLLTFVFAGFIAFSTGSSWSTMAILYPILLPLTWQLGNEAGLATEQLMPIFYNVTASVLAGAVLGDHCSPISDTTVLSSLATSCNHIDHVRTQLPYALTVGGVSVFVGGILFLIGLPFIVNLAIGVGMMYGVIRFIGTRPE